MPLPKRVNITRSEPVVVKPGSSMSVHRNGERNSCPSSDHREKRHVGEASTRITETVKWSNGNVTKNYVDAVTCKFCGTQWNQEWCYL